ncbi:hypothetical protein [Burkholderia gladioli]|uniref:hypothetical protein n=1 Tax=Burkholderia gladioli TaxID=28095 RepID=UPI000F8119B4|nr:hypothetical protein [Burkholderia gladioli]
MDYVFASFFAAFAALVFSVFTSFIASRSRRPIYRKIMWGYVAGLLIADIAITVLQLSPAIMAFGSLLSTILGVAMQLGIAVKLGHIVMTDAPSQRQPGRYGMGTTTTDDVRDSTNPIHYGSHDPLRNW